MCDDYSASGGVVEQYQGCGGFVVWLREKELGGLGEF